MLVIEGNSNKSRIVENWIRKEYMGNRLAIVDNRGVHNFTEIDGVEYYKLEATVEDVIAEFNIEGNTFLSEYDWIVFYVNIPTDDLILFQELDRKIPQNIVVTVQTDKGITTKYFL